MYDAVGPSLVAQLLVSVGATIYSGFPKDAWNAYLSAQTSKTGSVNDLEQVFFRSKGGSGSTNHDVLDSYLNSKGYTGSYKDKIIQLCQTGTSL